MGINYAGASYACQRYIGGPSHVRSLRASPEVNWVVLAPIMVHGTQ